LTTSDPIPLELGIGDADAGNALTLQYAIDGGRVTAFGPVSRGGSVSVAFPQGNLAKEPGDHTITFYVSDGTDVSAGVQRSYTITAAPVLQLITPGTGSLGPISAGQGQSVTVNVIGTATVSIQFQVDGSSAWTPISGSFQPNSDQSVAVPSGAFVTTTGLHTVLLRAVDSVQFSEPVVVWYQHGEISNSPPNIYIAKSGREGNGLIRSTGPTLADRRVALFISDPDNPTWLRLEWSLGYAGAWVRAGEFPQGVATVTIPASVFASLQIGNSISVRFRVFDGGTYSDTVGNSFQWNQAPSVTVTSPVSLEVPPAGPATPVPIALSFSDSGAVSWRWSLRYRFDSSSTWKTAEWGLWFPASLSFSIQPAEFVNHLLWSQQHGIEFEISDGLEQGYATLPYTVTPPPNNNFAPTIAVVTPERRVHRTVASTADRLFNLTIGDQDNGPLYVDYRFGTRAWSANRMFPAPGTIALAIPAWQFNANLQPGRHEITFRVSDGFSHGADSTAVAAYTVNSAPTLTAATTAITLPETGKFEAAVSFTLSDTDGDALSFLYAIDSTIDWQVHRSGVTGGSLELKFTDEWPSPRLALGTHTLACRLSDGLDVSDSVVLSITVTEGTTEDDDGLSGGAIAGIVVGVVVVIGAAAAAVFFLVIRKGNGSANEEKAEA
jgi:hypothetical protein